MDRNLQGADTAPAVMDRAKAMIFSPSAEWPRVAAETDSVRDVFVRYVVPLAAIGPVASFIGGQVFGLEILGVSYKPSFGTGLATLFAGYVLSLAAIFVVAWIASFLAGKFGGREDFARAFKLCAYAFTAAWVVGVFGLVPALAVLGLLGLYSLYVLYLGVTPMVGVPRDRALGYTTVTVLAAIVVNIVVGMLAASMTGSLGAAAALSAGDEDATIEVDVPGYGAMRIEDRGDTQTMDIPGMGRLEVSRDGETVNIEGENFSGAVDESGFTATAGE